MTPQFLPDAPAPGAIVRVRQRQYLVEDVQPPPAPGDASVAFLRKLIEHPMTAAEGATT